MSITESKQICSITVIFPVESDEKAVGVKAKFSEIVKDIDLAKIDFRISDIRVPTQ